MYGADSGWAGFDPDDGLQDAKVDDFTYGEHRTAEYQAERSTDVTHQSQRRIRYFSLDVRVHQVWEEYLQSQLAVNNGEKLKYRYRCR